MEVTVECLDGEEWRPSAHPRTVGLLVSNMGRIIGRKGYVLKGHVTEQGYRMVSAGYNKVQCSVARIVALTFVPNPDNKPCVNHKNANKLDNRIENLEWVTYSENACHARDLGLLSFRKGEASHRAILSDKEAREIYDLTQHTQFTQHEIAAWYDAHRTTVSYIKLGRRFQPATGQTPIYPRRKS